MNDYIKEWYISQFPEDEVGNEIDPDATFKELEKKYIRYTYEYLGVWDIIVRERVFEELALRMGVDYDYVYDRWLNPQNY